MMSDRRRRRTGNQGRLDLAWRRIVGVRGCKVLRGIGPGKGVGSLALEDVRGTQGNRTWHGVGSLALEDR